MRLTVVDPERVELSNLGQLVVSMIIFFGGPVYGVGPIVDLDDEPLTILAIKGCAS
jgi:hypothetical protein